MIEREHVCPYDVESSYYRQVFEARYGQTNAEVIPRFWKQPFTTVVDPSARCLSNYESSKTNTLKEKTKEGQHTVLKSNKSLVAIGPEGRLAKMRSMYGEIPLSPAHLM